ncbi:DUF2316 family protein, partial [Staphylococcus aureus]|nr:DUF2316 family protein [Staphylococcus aureus]
NLVNYEYKYKGLINLFFEKMVNISLNKHQRHVTSEELKAHFHESTLSIENIAQEMNISIEEVERVLDMDAPNGFFGNK